MKKYKVKSRELSKLLIDTMLTDYNLTLEDIEKQDHIDGVVWCSYYTWTLKKQEEYKQWFLNLLTTQVTPKISKKMAEKEWIWFDLMYGLKLEK